DRIQEIENATFGKDAYERNLLAAFYHKCGDLFLVAECQSGICGYIVTCTRGERAEIASIAVDPSARGSGVGSAMMEGTLRRLRRRGVPRVGLMVKVS